MRKNHKWYVQMFMRYKLFEGGLHMATKDTKGTGKRSQLYTADIKRTFSCSIKGDVLCIGNKFTHQPELYVRINPCCDVLTNHMLALELMNTLLRYYRQVDNDINMNR